LEKRSTLARQPTRVSSHWFRAEAKAVDLRSRVDQLLGVELVAAAVALVAAGAVVAADRAGALDVAVGQRATGRRGDGAERLARHDVTVVVEPGEELLHDRVVVARGGAGEQVVGQAEPVQILDDHPVVAVDQLARRRALRVGLHLHGRAVLVGARDHEHVVAGHAHVAAEHVGRHSEAGHMTDMAGAVGVGPGHRRENVTHEGKA
jgi:hypothetical protein